MTDISGTGVPDAAKILGFMQEHDWGDAADSGVYGFILITPMEGATGCTALVRPGTDVGMRVSFADWAAERLARFAEHGPEPDGWLKRSDGGWQLWARLRYLPRLD